MANWSSPVMILMNVACKLACFNVAETFFYSDLHSLGMYNLGFDEIHCSFRTDFGN
jgi:hypothetical protein